MSITPAFSPMPARSLPMGVSWASSPNLRRWTFDDLYEQCSDHMTEYMASSDEVGRRPSISPILRYSSSFRPSSAHGWAKSGVECAFATVSATGVRLPADSRGGSRPASAECVVDAEPGDRDGGCGCHREPDVDTAIVDQRAENCADKDGDERGPDGAELILRE